MRKIAQSGEHTSRTVFGPNASYFTISPSGFSWQNLPPVLEQDVIGRMKKGLPTTVALGVHGSFVVLYSDGNVTFDVATHYPAVDAMIRNSTENARRKGIAVRILSFVVLFALIRLPVHCSQPACGGPILCRIWRWLSIVEHPE
jgi:hypothetical protein